MAVYHDDPAERNGDDHDDDPLPCRWAGRGGADGTTDDPPPDDARPGPVVVLAADVVAQDITWLWHRRIPIGGVTILAGRPGCGKSLVTVDMAARISRGRPWPDGRPCATGRVLLLAAEDSVEHVIRPRLDAADADCSRVALLRAQRVRTSDGTEERPITLADVGAIEAALGVLPDCRLVIIDPLGAYLGGRVDAHRDNEVRAVLAPITRLAETRGLAVVIVAHTRKSAGAVADDAILGSRAFSGLARAVWHVAPDPDDKRDRLLLSGKNNWAAPAQGMRFSVVGGAGQPSLAWSPDPVDMSADDVFAAEAAAQRSTRRPPGPEPAERHEAEEWLRAALAEGPRLSRDIRADADQEDISWRTIRRAKKAIGAAHYRESPDGPYWWRLGPVGQVPVGQDAGNLANLADREKHRENHDVLAAESPVGQDTSNLATKPTTTQSTLFPDPPEDDPPTPSTTTDGTAYAPDHDAIPAAPAGKPRRTR